MPDKRILFGSEARGKVLRGATALADAVRITLGPRARSVLIARPWGTPLVCDDGVTIAKELTLPDPEEDLGARMIRQAATLTGDSVGDGTSTATVLAHAIYAEGVRNVVAGASAVELKRGLEHGLGVAVDAITSIARPVSSRLEKVQVASISAHGNAEIGEIVAEAVERVGGEGVITVQEAQGTSTELDVVEGTRFDRGYLSPYFVTDPRKMECVLEDAWILVHEKRVASSQGLVAVAERVLPTGRPLLVIAEDVQGEALATLVVNQIRGTLRAVAVKAPGFGDRRKAMLEDIAAITGARVISEDLGRSLETVTLEDLGSADRVIISNTTTTLVGGRGDPAAVADRLEQIRQQISQTKSDYDREKLEERLGRMTGGVAVIRVGAFSESEMASMKESLEDAINATRAAVAEGIVPGAGMALLRAAAALEQTEKEVEGDRRTAIRMLRAALEAPTRQIAVNSGLDPGVVVDRMRASDGFVGLDATTGEHVDLFEAGIVDAARAVRVGLESAVSVAATLLLSEATLITLPEEGTHPGPAIG